MKIRTKVTKQQRKKRRLRAIKNEFGVGELYFDKPMTLLWLSRKQIVQCSKVNKFREHYNSAESLINTLTMAKEGRCIVLYEDDKIDFANLDALREYLLIRKLAGI